MKRTLKVEAARQQSAFEGPALGTGKDRQRALTILAKSIYRELETQGYGEKEIVALAGELISEVTNRLSSDRDA